MSFELISTALADTTTTSAAGGSSNLSFLLLIGFAVAFYMLLWRPQAKRAKEHQNLISNLVKGDEIVTSGGIFGKITEVTEQYIALAIAPTVEIKVQKTAVANVLPKGTVKL